MAGAVNGRRCDGRPCPVAGAGVSRAVGWGSMESRGGREEIAKLGVYSRGRAWSRLVSSLVRSRLND